MLRALVGFAVLIGSAFALAAPVPKGVKPTVLYFPTAVGAKWVYERPGRPDEIVVVSKVEKDGDSLIVSREGIEGTAMAYAPVIVSAEGLRQAREQANGQVGWVLKSKLKSGDSWDVPDGGKRTVYGPEDVTVPAGKFKALRIEWKPDGATRVSWYVPGIGEVKRVEKFNGQEIVRRSLKSFTPPPKPKK
jgi:hypothetical protein